MTGVLGEPGTASLSRVFEPHVINGVELRNRVVRSPHGTGLAGPRLEITDDLIAYHVARAKGGVALSILELGGIHASCPILIRNVDDSVIPGYRRLTEAVHAHGMKIFQQLGHVGPNFEPPDGSAPWAASAVPAAPHGRLPRAISETEIADIVAAFAAAARRCREGGIDGVEIHGAHGYLLGSFLAPATNLRRDRYGGSLEGRLKIVFEVLAAVRAEVGRDYPLGIRLSPDPGMDGMIDPTSAADICRALLATGHLDYVNMSCGSGYQPERTEGGSHEPHGYELEFVRAAARATRDASGTSIVTGRFLSLADVEAVLARGDADLVSMVRALIADPDLIVKTREGREGEVRPCIGCNQACTAGIRGPRFRTNCTVNAGAGDELKLGDHHLKRTASPRRVMVVGAGPAGLEAARVAAIVGHQVSIYEALPVVGGQLALTRQSPRRAEVAGYIDYLEREVRRLGVPVSCETPVDASLIEATDVDTLLIATGSVPRRAGFQAMLPGLDLGARSDRSLLTSREVLSGAQVGGSVVVLDDAGHYESIDVIEHLLDRGVAVHLVTRYPTVGFRLDGDAKSWEALGRPHLRWMLRHDTFQLHPRSSVVSFTGGRATLAPIDAPEVQDSIDVDNIVAISTNEPVNDLVAVAHATGRSVRVAGDAVDGPRYLRHAVLDGHMAARSLEPEWVRPVLT